MYLWHNTFWCMLSSFCWWQWSTVECSSPVLYFLKQCCRISSKKNVHLPDHVPFAFQLSMYVFFASFYFVQFMSLHRTWVGTHVEICFIGISNAKYKIIWLVVGCENKKLILFFFIVIFVFHYIVNKISLSSFPVNSK